MSDLIRQALGWETGPWPPDFYALLGLLPGPADPDQVEAAVLERMEKLRVFQLVHPESVTEAMNLLARALITLSDSNAKSVYDQELNVNSSPPPVAQQIPTIDDSPLGNPEPPALPESQAFPSEKKTSTSPPPLPSQPLAVAPIFGESLPTRMPTTYERSLTGEWQPPRSRSTQRKVKRRNRPAEQTIVRWVVQVRRLLDAWDEAGDWLSIPQLTFATRIEAVHLILALRTIAQSGPLVLDPAGPGKSIIQLAESRPTSSGLMDITEPEREQLAKDWRKGRRIIWDEYQKTRNRMRRRSRRLRLPPAWPKSMATWGLMAFAGATLLIVVVRSWRGV